MNTFNQVRAAINAWPAYCKFLESRGINPVTVRRLSDLPLTDKSSFGKLAATISLDTVRHILPSTGSTGGDMCFGLYTREEAMRSAITINSMLESTYDTKRRKTLLLNVLPGALHIPSETATVACIGVRADTAIKVIQSFGHHYDQILIIGEPKFIKHLIDSGVRQSIPWRLLPIQILIGGEWFSETYRIYLESIVGSGKIRSSMGTAELGLDYFRETDETIAVRHVLLNNKGLLYRLFGQDYVPMIFTYNPEAVIVETLSPIKGRPGPIALTTTDASRAMPLLRYKIGDIGMLLDRADIKRALESVGFHAAIDAKGLPLLAHFGRGRHVNGVTPELIQEILYSSHSIAQASTGQFLLDDDGNRLMIQINASVALDSQLVYEFKQAFIRMPVSLEIMTFAQFPITLDFERKGVYIHEDSYSKHRRDETLHVSY